MEQEIKLGKYTYVTHSLLSWGHYGGAGSIGLANLRYLERRFGQHMVVGHGLLQDMIEGDVDFRLDVGMGAHHGKALVAPLLIIAGHGGQDGQTAWLKMRHSADEILQGLENYPVLDDEILAEVEEEWLVEALEDYELPERLQEALDALPLDIQTELVRRAYREACEEANYQAEPEYSGMYIDWDKLGKYFINEFEMWFPDTIGEDMNFILEDIARFADKAITALEGCRPDPGKLEFGKFGNVRVNEEISEIIENLEVLR